MSTAAREELHRLVDHLPETDVSAALRLVESLVSRHDPLDAPPREAEELGEHGERAWTEGVEDLDAGRKHPWEAVKREFGL